MNESLSALHLAATWWMTGLVWFVQVVYYPSLRDYDRGNFAMIERRNTTRTGFVVGPPMLIEIGTCVVLLWLRFSILFLASAILLGVVWGLTALFAVPAHRRLESGFDEQAWQRLMHANGARAVAWLLRAMLATVALA